MRERPAIGFCIVALMLLLVLSCRPNVMPSRDRTDEGSRDAAIADSGKQTTPYPICPGTEFGEGAPETDDCELAGCGLNGSWMGRNFRLRELRLTLQKAHSR